MVFSLRPMRRTQLISPWGVGAIVPFPNDESLMIAGLDMWRFGNDKSEFIIIDERLAKRLGVKELRCPPDFRDIKTDGTNAQITIPAVRFPRWQYCPFCGTMSKTGYYTKQETCDGFSWKNGRTCKDKPFKRKLIPERFIVVCPEGHVDDFPIMEWVHYNPKNPHTITDSCRIRRSTGGTSASLAGVFYECSCGAKRSMAGATGKGALEKIGYKCKGSKPWLGMEEDKEHSCDNPNIKVVQRGGTNVWFADVRSSIYISLEDVEADRRILNVADEFYDQIINSRTDDQLDRNHVEILAKARHVDPDELYNIFIKRIEGHGFEEDISEDISEEAYRLSEYNVLIKNSGNDKADLHTINKSIEIYDSSIQPFFKSISLIPKLRETRAFVGFSRLQPDETRNLKDKQKMLRLGKGDWLPAIKVYGEGIFFEFNEEYLESWAIQNNVKKRIEKMNSAYRQMIFKRNGDTDDLNPKYVLIHTFAHLLINQLSYECGYGSSSIRERMYCDKSGEEHTMHGVLIYTASGDTDGSLGGLVRQGQPGRIEDTIIAAIKNAEWCSADPICIQSSGQGPDSCNLAACHNCAVLPETCCENGNRLLDRGLVVGTLEDEKIGLFWGLLNK